MYIHPFVAGMLGAFLGELIFVFVAAIINDKRGKK